jgi:hypothetical protein
LIQEADAPSGSIGLFLVYPDPFDRDAFLRNLDFLFRQPNKSLSEILLSSNYHSINPNNERSLTYFILTDLQFGRGCNGIHVSEGVPVMKSTYPLVSVLLLAALSSTVSAQWVATSLNPGSGAADSAAYATYGGQQAGIIGAHAALWSGTPGLSTLLTPTGASSSFAMSVSGGQQAGWATFGTTRRAGVWNGTAASWISLAPASATASEVQATNGVQQVGVATIGGITRASLWSGTAASWVDLHPTIAGSSAAIALHGNQQVGSAFVNNSTQAALWSGSAASYVNLNPTSATSSVLFATNGTRQAGVAFFGGQARAGLWSGTASSFVDLTPTGASEAIIYGMFGDFQVGQARNRAGLWRGTRASFLDLHAALGSGYTSSTAFGMFSDGVNDFIVGSAYNATGRQEAILWTQPVPEPMTMTVLALGALTALRRKRK